MKHFKLTNETKTTITGEIVYRIEATIDNPKLGIKKGDKGGFLKSINSLVSGNAWVYGNALVCGDAQVYGNALVCGDAQVYGNARVCGDARVYGNALVCGDAQVYGNALVYGDARVCGDAQVYGNASVYGDARVDSVSSIIVICIAMKYSITVTKKLIFIGCQMFKTKKALKITKKQAKELGLEEKYYTAYKEMIKGALKIVK